MYAGSTSRIGQAGIGGRRKMHGRALLAVHQCHVGVYTQRVLQALRQPGAGTTELFVAVHGISVHLCHKAAIGLPQAFRYRDGAIAVLLQPLLHGLQHTGLIKCHLRQQHQRYRLSLCCCQAACCGQPAHVPAHGFHDEYAPAPHAAHIVRDLAQAAGQVLGGGWKARAEVGTFQVVIDGFGHPQRQQGQSKALGQLAQAQGGFHGAITAVEQHIAYIETLQYRRQLRPLRGRFVIRCQHLAAGAKAGAGQPAQPAHL